MTIKSGVCKFCGKHFEYEYNGGRERQFCDFTCKKKSDNKKVSAYLKKRYSEDPEFRKKRSRDNCEGVRRRCQQAKSEAMGRIINEIIECETTTEILEILEKNFRMKREVYDPNAR